VPDASPVQVPEGNPDRVPPKNSIKPTSPADFHRRAAGGCARHDGHVLTVHEEQDGRPEAG